MNRLFFLNPSASFNGPDRTAMGLREMPAWRVFFDKKISYAGKYSACRILFLQFSQWSDFL